jgi:hypothetical protein
MYLTSDDWNPRSLSENALFPQLVVISEK